MSEKHVNSETQERKKRIDRIIEDYDKQGIHRTGTEVDLISARWLEHEFKTLGLKSVLDGFIFERIDIKEASIQIGNRKFEGIPIFDSFINENEAITGKLGRFTSNSTIGVAQLGNDKILTKERRNNRHRGLVVASTHLSPGLVPFNAESFKEPFPPPVLQMSSDTWSWLSKGMESNAEATLAIRVKRTRVKAFNVVVRLEGKDQNLSPLMILTPRSGWWHCASERGGGIACFLEMMRVMCSKSLNRDVLFLATTGHELGHLGLEHFIEKDPTIVKNAKAWIQLGANFAAAKLPQFSEKIPPLVVSHASDKDIEKLALEAMVRVGVAPDIRIPIGKRPISEARNIFDGDGRFFSLAGTNSLFHHPNDRWPDAIDLNKTVKIIEAIISFGIKLAS